MSPSNQGVYRFTIVLGLMLLAFGGSELYKRASIDIQGTVASSITTCQQPQNNRCATRYTVKTPGGSEVSYVAGFTDGALARRLPEGTYIDKEKWHFQYKINGLIVDDFPSFSMALYVYVGRF